VTTADQITYNRGVLILLFRSGTNLAIVTGETLRHNRLRFMLLEISMKALFHTLLICGLLLAIPCSALAGIYKYRDANGRLTFVDDESRIPSQFRDNVSSVAEAEDSLVVYDSEDIEEKSSTAHAEQKEADRTTLKKQLQKFQTPVDIKGNRVLVPVEVAVGNNRQAGICCDEATRLIERQVCSLSINTVKSDCYIWSASMTIS